ncbi:MAG TPA: peroxiredoxin, partial [Allosphingosinicella sp.]
MTIQVGDRLPKANFVKATPDGPQPIDGEDYFRGRRVAIFSVPGAFT